MRITTPLHLGIVLAASALIAATSALATGANVAQGPRYEVSGSLPGPDGGWDYASVDPVSGKLFIARATSVTVSDIVGNAAMRSIGTLARSHAVVPLPNRELLVTSGSDDSVRIFDQDDGRETARIAVGKKPDAALYDPVSHHAIVMNAAGGTVSVINIATHAVVRTIGLKPGLEFAQVGAAQTLFVNNEDANEIETADLRTGEAGVPIKLAGCEEPSGLAYDSRRHWLVSACGNGKAAVVDTVTRQVLALLDIGMGPDAVILDAARRLAFIPCGTTGTLTVISLSGAVPKVVGTVVTAVGARTGAVDPRTGTIYLPTADFFSPATPSVRPLPKPGTFRILVVRPGRA